MQQSVYDFGLVWPPEDAGCGCHEIVAPHAVIVLSWGIAFLEYCFQVPANRIGFMGNGGPFTLMQLKIIQEVISLVIFCVVANVLFQGQQLHWNHLAAMVCLVLAVYFVFK